ncbi:hypothetical protein [Streptomyces chattanoogensis]|uniref:hypothetical protein n=1 Tax=Streptomyces chattanoogensis TaxID=66876 RepID=UPI0005D7AA7D|nr:hypothetical protein T261_7383 [Streptomyces lydicus]
MPPSPAPSIPPVTSNTPDTPVSSADRSRSVLPPAVQRLLPARPVVGFVALLAVLFALSYGVGAAAGPVAPGLHPAGGPRTGGPAPAHSGDMGRMPGMDGMR